jgi:hypothetical protein
MGILNRRNCCHSDHGICGLQQISEGGRGTNGEQINLGTAERQRRDSCLNQSLYQSSADEAAGTDDDDPIRSLWSEIEMGDHVTKVPLSDLFNSYRKTMRDNTAVRRLAGHAKV